MELNPAWCAAVFVSSVCAVHAEAQNPVSNGWKPIATSRDLIPGTESNYSSFNQPSVNERGVVVFRARGRGPGEPVRGIYMRRMGSSNQPIVTLFQRGDAVPEPNNSDEVDKGSNQGLLEFPSIPRIDQGSETMATRGMSQPVWIYTLPDGTETRVGTAGVYAVGHNGEPETAMSLLGAVTDATTGATVFPEYSVPGYETAVRFDQFPGSPSVTDRDVIVTKANWTDPETSLGKTGVFFRDLGDAGSPVERIASSDTVIPGTVDPEVKFGSTAPPSAARGKVVFLGVDVEEAPTLGGIYLADIEADPELVPLVPIGAQVPGEETGVGFTRLGEALAFDGRWLAFWGAWGAESRPLTLQCPVDGNPDVIAWCNELHPAGNTVQIPLAQGMFVQDTRSGTIYPIAKTGSDPEDVSDFIYWNFSGRAPGAGEGGGSGGGGGGGEGEGGTAADEEGELARWRSTSFVAVSSATNGGGLGNGFVVAFKAKVGETDGIYVASGPNGGPAEAVLTTEMPGSAVDSLASEGARITSLALERESLRGKWFVIGASTTDDSTGESVAGIFASGANKSSSDFNGDGKSDIFWQGNGSGEPRIWLMDGLRVLGATVPALGSTNGFTAEGAGDLDGDGTSDVVWRDGSTGVFHGWRMVGSLLAENWQLSVPVPFAWKLVATGDLDGNGTADLVQMYGGTQQVRGWLMEGGTRTAGGTIGFATGMTLAGSGDIDGDGSMDLLWQDGDGYMHVWFMRGLAIASSARIETAHGVGDEWVVAAVRDLDGDGRADIVWRNSLSGVLFGWLMDGASRKQTGVITRAVSLQWSLLSASDLDGDGRGDLVWRHRVTGNVHAWLMNGLARRIGGLLGQQDGMYEPLQ